jgi:hypothetical protein
MGDELSQGAGGGGGEVNGQATPAASSSGLVMAGVLAKLLGVTVQTVYNYRDAGMKPDGVNGAGHAVWDAEKAREWVKGYRPATGKGGRRPGAGRKKKSDRATERQSDSEGAAERKSESETAAGPAVALSHDRTAALPPATPGRVDVSSVEAVLRSVGDLELRPLDVKNAGELLGVATARLELDQSLGRVVDAAEAFSAWGRALATVRRQLDGLPGRIVEAAVSLGLAPDKGVEMRERVEAEVRRVKGMLAADPFEKKKTTAAA